VLLPKMTRWTKALITACVLEVPLLTILVGGGQGDLQKSSLVSIVVWYHLIPLAIISWGFLALFGHGEPSLGNVSLWKMLYWFATFALQVALTTPLILLFINLLERVRRAEGAGPPRGHGE
jgi:hypothetical protein